MMFYSFGEISAEIPWIRNALKVRLKEIAELLRICGVVVGVVGGQQHPYIGLPLSNPSNWLDPVLPGRRVSNTTRSERSWFKAASDALAVGG
jgi:hypothetical protein